MKLLTALQLIDSNNLPKPSANRETLQDVLNIVFVIIGALAFLMLVIAGLRYVLSQGDANKVAEIKRQILFALAGLVVAAMAATIVNFILGRV
jgi:hypothetical protein